MLTRFVTNAVRSVVSAPRRTMAGQPFGHPAIEDQFYVTPRVNGELPLPGKFSVSPRVAVTHLVTFSSAVMLWFLSREARVIPIELEKVSIANPESGAMETFLKPTGVWTQTAATARLYPGYEVVQEPSPNVAPNREKDVLLAMELYNKQMDQYAAGNTAFIGTPGQLFFPDKASILPPLGMPKAQLDAIKAAAKDAAAKEASA